MTDMTKTTEIELYANAHDKSQVTSDKTSEADNNYESSPLSLLLTSIYSESTGKRESVRDEIWKLFGKYFDYTDFNSYTDKNEAENNDKKIRKLARNTYIQKLHEEGVTVTRNIYIQKLYEDGTIVTQNNSFVTVEWGNYKADREVKDDGRSSARNAFVSILRQKYKKEWPFLKRPNLNGKPDLQVIEVASNSVQTLKELVPKSKKKVKQVNLEETSTKLKAFEAELKERDKKVEAMQAELEQRDKKVKAMQAELEQRNKEETAKAMQAELEQRNKEEATKAMQAELEQRNKEETAKAMQAELEQRNKEEATKAMQAELEQRKNDEAAKAIQLELKQQKEKVLTEIKTVTYQIEQYEKAEAEANKKHEAVPEVEKEILQVEFDAINTDIKAVQLELDKYKKAAEVKARTADEEINAVNSLLQLSESITGSIVQKKKNTDTIFHNKVRNMSKKVKEQLKTDTDSSIYNTKKRNLILEYSDNEANDDDDNDDDDMFFCQNIEEGFKNGKINHNSYKRLKALNSFLLECEKENIITISTKDINETCVTNVTINTKETKETNNTKEIIMTNETKVITSTKVSKKMLNCVLGWNKLKVSSPLELNKKIRKMVDEDQGGIWKKANGKYNQSLKNPTWGIYELFRKIGVRPRLRGDKIDDPGKEDMVYYKEWEFVCGDSFKNAYPRLAQGFSYSPEKGNRVRKRSKKEEKNSTNKQT
jgi:hypothetical protein